MNVNAVYRTVVNVRAFTVTASAAVAVIFRDKHENMRANKIAERNDTQNFNVIIIREVQ